MLQCSSSCCLLCCYEDAFYQPRYSLKVHMYMLEGRLIFQKIPKILFMCFLTDSIKESIHSKFELPVKFYGGIIHH